MIDEKRRIVSSPMVANITLAAWIFADVIRLLVLVQLTLPGLINAASAFVLLIMTVFVIMRPLPTRQDLSATSITVAVAAIVWPLAFLTVSSNATLPSIAALVVQLCALIMMFSATIVLGSNFSIFPHYRQVIVSGPYALVRHPLYAAYLTFDGAMVCDQGTISVLLLWIVEAALLAWRAEREERLLAACTADYVRYITQVRYRFIPFVY